FLPRVGFTAATPTKHDVFGCDPHPDRDQRFPATSCAHEHSCLPYATTSWRPARGLAPADQNIDHRPCSVKRRGRDRLPLFQRCTKMTAVSAVGRLNPMCKRIETDRSPVHSAAAPEIAPSAKSAGTIDSVPIAGSSSGWAT